MRKRHLLSRTYILIAALCFMWLVPAAAQAHYRVVRLNIPAGYRVSPALQDINDLGWLSLTERTPGLPERALLLQQRGGLTALPGLGGSCSFGNSLNNLHHAAGGACLAGDQVRHATLWRNGKVRDLDQFGGSGSSALGINNSDHVVGDFWFSDGSAKAFLWQNGTWTDLGSLGGSLTFPTNINDSDVVTGQSDISNNPDPIFGIPPHHAYAWSSGTLTDLGQVFGGKFSWGTDVDANGRILGAADYAGDGVAHGFVWDQGSITDLAPLPGDQVSWALAMNGQGQVVGSSGLSDPNQYAPPDEDMLCPCRGVIWENGQEYDLNTLVPKGWVVWLGRRINEKGQIVARAQYNNGPLHDILLQPIKGADNDRSATEKKWAPSTQPLRQARPARLRRNVDGKLAIERTRG